MDATLATFPHEDQAFRAFVQATFQRLAGTGRIVDPMALETSIRRYHTRAAVRPQEALGALGRPVWYVYRDGRPGVRVENDWWQQPGCATVRFGRDGRFIAADDAACALVDMPPGGLVGRHWSELVRGDPGDDVADGLWTLLDQRGWAQSVFDFRREDGGYRVIEYHSQSTPDRDVFVSYWRELALIHPTAEMEGPAG